MNIKTFTEINRIHVPQETVNNLGGKTIDTIHSVLYPYSHLSKDLQNFLDTLQKQGYLEQLLSIRFYHVGPTYLRPNIEQKGLINEHSLLNGVHKELFDQVHNRMNPAKRHGFDPNSTIFGYKNTSSMERRGIYLSNKAHQVWAYPIPESIRLYFTFFSENWNELTQEEKQKITNYMQDFERDLSQGTDIWELSILNPTLASIWLEQLKNMPQDELEYIFGEEDITEYIGSANIEIDKRIPHCHMRLIETIHHKNIQERWGMRCSNLLKQL